MATSGQPVLVSDDLGLTWSASGHASWLGDGPACDIAAVMTVQYLGSKGA